MKCDKIRDYEAENFKLGFKLGTLTGLILATAIFFGLFK